MQFSCADIWWSWRLVADLGTAVKTELEHAWAVRATPSGSGLFVWLSVSETEAFTSSLCSTLKQNLQRDVYCLASICVSPQPTIDLRSIVCGIMSSNRRLMWDRSAPASPLHSSSSAPQEEHFSSAGRSSFKGAGISSWFAPRLCSRRRKAACVTFPHEADSVLPGWPSSAFKRTRSNDTNAADCGEQHSGYSALLMCCICSRSEALISALDMSRLLLPDIYQAGGEALSPRCSFCRDSTFTLLAAISSRQRGVCSSSSSSTPRLLLFMLRLFTHSVLFSFAFYPGRGWLVGCPLPPSPSFNPL